MNILITAFEPFENINTNSSLEVLRKVDIKKDNIILQKNKFMI